MLIDELIIANNNLVNIVVSPVPLINQISQFAPHFNKPNNYNDIKFCLCETYFCFQGKTYYCLQGVTMVTMNCYS